MDARDELDSIVRELNAIITELEDIACGVRHEFKGIGSENCADCVNGVLSSYYSTRQRLNCVNIETTIESGIRGRNFF